jgi:signal transduction histidine kinase
VTDHQGLVLARSGRLAADAPPGADAAGMPWFLEKLILAVLPGEADATADLPDDQTHLFMRPVVDALAGRPTSLRRRPSTGDAVVVSAAVPIRDSAGVRGAVLVEQTTGAILSIQNLALQRLFGITLLFFSLISIGLLAFAARLVARIDRLRHAVEANNGPDGHVARPLGTDGPCDEIGELARSLAALPGRPQGPDDCVRATIARLWDEASEPVDCDLAALLRDRIERLRAAYRGVDLALLGADGSVRITAAPDLVAEAIDQLVAQAVCLQQPGSRIAIRCRMRDDSVELAVCHEVPRQPPAASADALERARRAPGMRWVQLIGEFHGAALRTTAHKDPATVMVSLSFPRGA